MFNDLMISAKKLLMRKDVQQGIVYLSSASQILEAMRNASEIGGTVSKVLAAGSAAGTILHTFSNMENSDDTLRSMGYSEITSTISYAYDCLNKSDISMRNIQISEGESIRLWDCGVAAILYGNENLLDSLWILEGKDIGEVIRGIVWSKSKSKMITISKENHSYVYNTLDLSAPGQYVGKPDLQKTCDRFRRYENSRCILIVGPTGSGKSTLAQLIANEMEPDGKLLKITTSMMRNIDSSVIVPIVDILKPTVLLIDDVQTILKNEDVMLPLLEIMHGIPGRSLVIGTYMITVDEKFRDDEGKMIPGSFYFPGMRPGRIDEFIFLSFPDREERRNILLSYMDESMLTDDILDATENMTGAYLKELSTRLKIHGTDSWEDEIDSLRASLPVSQKDDDIMDDD